MGTKVSTRNYCSDRTYQIMKEANLKLDAVQLTPKDFDRAADLLVEAFYNNPAHVYIYMSPNESDRLKAIRWGFRRNLI